MLWKRLMIGWLSVVLLVGVMLPGLASDTDLKPVEQEAVMATATDLTVPEPLPPAEDITMASALNGYTGDVHPTKMRDGIYKSYCESTLKEGAHSLVITAP